MTYRVPTTTAGYILLGRAWVRTRTLAQTSSNWPLKEFLALAECCSCIVWSRAYRGTRPQIALLGSAAAAPSSAVAATFHGDRVQTVCWIQHSTYTVGPYIDDLRRFSASAAVMNIRGERCGNWWNERRRRLQAANSNHATERKAVVLFVQGCGCSHRLAAILTFCIRYM